MDNIGQNVNRQLNVFSDFFYRETTGKNSITNVALVQQKKSGKISDSSIYTRVKSTLNIGKSRFQNKN